MVSLRDAHLARDLIHGDISTGEFYGLKDISRFQDRIISDLISRQQELSQRPGHVNYTEDYIVCLNKPKQNRMGNLWISIDRRSMTILDVSTHTD